MHGVETLGLPPGQVDTPDGTNLESGLLDALDDPASKATFHCIRLDHGQGTLRHRVDYIRRAEPELGEGDREIANASVFWLKFVKRAEIKETPEGTELMNEAKELLAIFTKSAKTASANRQ
jgi:hypothetical protein